MVAVKNQNNALLNEFAHLSQPISIEGILDSPEAMTNNPWVAEPLRFFDCCPVSYGGAALILMSREAARRTGRPPVRISGIGQATDTLAVHEREEPTDLLAVRRAAEQAYLTLLAARLELAPGLVDHLNANIDPRRDPQAYLSTLNRIFKLVALRAFPGQHCAAMAGRDWSDFVAARMADAESAEALAVLAAGHYDPRPQFDPAVMSELTRHWIRRYG